MDKPRLLIATDTFLPRRDGISTFLSRAIPLLKDRFEITVIAPAFGPISAEGYELVSIPVQRQVFGEFRLTRRTQRIKQVVAKADVVWSHTIGPIAKICVDEARAAGVPRVCFVHSREWELIPRYLNIKWFRRVVEWIVFHRMRRVYNQMTLALVPSKDEALLFQRHGIDVPTQVVHVGVDPYRFTAQPNKVEAKQNVGLDSSHTVIGYTGRISHEKDLDTLIRAFLWLKRSDEETTLLLVGSGIPELEAKYAAKRGVVHVKSVEDVTPYVQAMDVFVMPSLTETSSLSTLEAMSCKLPVVTTRVGLMKDYVEDGKNGFTFARGDWMKLARHLKKLSEDVVLRSRLGEEARKSVLNHFVLETNVKKMGDTIEKVL